MIGPATGVRYIRLRLHRLTAAPLRGRFRALRPASLRVINTFARNDSLPESDDLRA